MTTWKYLNEEKPAANGKYHTAAIVIDATPVLYLASDYWKDGHFYYEDEPETISDEGILAWAAIEKENEWPEIDFEEFNRHGLMEALLSSVEVTKL